MARDNPDKFGFRGNFFTISDLRNIKKTLRPPSGLAKEDGTSSYALLTSLNSKPRSPVRIYKPQGVGYYYTHNNVESDDIFLHAMTDDWEDRWKLEVPATGIGSIEINQIKDATNTLHASARTLPEKSVFTVLFTEEQIELYKQYGANCVYMDATHSLTQYGYFVLSLGVEDVNGKPPTGTLSPPWTQPHPTLPHPPPHHTQPGPYHTQPGPHHTPTRS